MERRKFIKGMGAAGATAAASGIGLAAFTGGAAAADTSLEATDPSAVTTDDGEIKYVAFGGRLRTEWDGLDTEATHGWYEIETRVNTGGGWSNWRSHGAASGPLGDEQGAANHDGDGAFEHGEENTSGSWGGTNDSNTGPGTDGSFQFKYGDENNNQDYAIAGSGNNLRDAANKYDTSVFEAGDDGDTQTTEVQFRTTCRLYDGEVGNGGSKLIEDSDEAKFTVTVNNRTATANTGGEINGEVGADES